MWIINGYSPFVLLFSWTVLNTSSALTTTGLDQTTISAADTTAHTSDTTSNVTLGASPSAEGTSSPTGTQQTVTYNSMTTESTLNFSQQETGFSTTGVTKAIIANSEGPTQTEFYGSTVTSVTSGSEGKSDTTLITATDHTVFNSTATQNSSSDSTGTVPIYESTTTADDLTTGILQQTTQGIFMVNATETENTSTTESAGTPGQSSSFPTPLGSSVMSETTQKMYTTERTTINSETSPEDGPDAMTTNGHQTELGSTSFPTEPTSYSIPLSTPPAHQPSGGETSGTTASPTSLIPAQSTLSPMGSSTGTSHEVTSSGTVSVTGTMSTAMLTAGTISVTETDSNQASSSTVLAKDTTPSTIMFPQTTVSITETGLPTLTSSETIAVTEAGLSKVTSSGTASVTETSSSGVTTSGTVSLSETGPSTPTSSETGLVTETVLSTLASSGTIAVTKTDPSSLTSSGTIAVTEAGLSKVTSSGTASATETSSSGVTTSGTVSLSETVPSTLTSSGTIAVTEAGLSKVTSSGTASATETSSSEVTTSGTVSLSKTGPSTPTSSGTIAVTETAPSTLTSSETIAVTDAGLSKVTSSGTASATETSYSEVTTSGTVSLSETVPSTLTSSGTIAITDAGLEKVTSSGTASATETSSSGVTTSGTVSLSETVPSTLTSSGTIAVTEAGLSKVTSSGTASATETSSSEVTTSGTVSLSKTGPSTPTSSGTIAVTETAPRTLTSSGTIAVTEADLSKVTFSETASATETSSNAVTTSGTHSVTETGQDIVTSSETVVFTEPSLGAATTPGTVSETMMSLGPVMPSGTVSIIKSDTTEMTSPGTVSATGIDQSTASPTGTMSGIETYSSTDTPKASILITETIQSTSSAKGSASVTETIPSETGTVVETTPSTVSPTGTISDAGTATSTVTPSETAAATNPRTVSSAEIVSVTGVAFSAVTQTVSNINTGLMTTTGVYSKVNVNTVSSPSAHTEIHEMTTAPYVCTPSCRNGGTCENGHCVCPSATTGPSCQTLIPFYGPWSPYSHCSHSCGDAAVRTRSRNCTDNSGNKLVDTVCRGAELGLPTETQPCNVSQCIASINPCQDRRIPYPCGIHGCSLVDEKGSFVCNCNLGFSLKPGTSTICLDDDECSLERNDCTNDDGSGTATGVKSCHNTDGGYTCVCAPGFRNRNGTRLCDDVDECALGSHDCDGPQRAECRNTVGSYTCSCRQGSQGDGRSGTCLEPLIYPLANQFRLPYRNASYPVLSEFFFPKYGLPANDGAIYPSLYISQNGLVMISKATQQSTIRRTFTTPPTVSLNHFTFPTGFNEVGIIAPYWANILLLDDKDGRGIYYKEFTTVAELTRVTAEISPARFGLAKAEYILIVTWNKVQYSSQNPEQTATFQLVLMTDFINVGAQFYYADRQMGWRFTLDPAKQANVPVRVGHLLRDNGLTKAEEWNVSYSTVANKENLERIDVIQRYLDWKPFNLTANDPATFVNPGLKCRDWIQSEREFIATYGEVTNGFAGRCPDSHKQLTSSWKSDVTVTSTGGREATCHKLTFPTTASGNQSWTPNCCYFSSNSINADLREIRVSEWRGLQGSNLLTRYKPGTLQHTAERNAYRWCCQDSSLHCNDYLQLRPLSDASTFVPPVIGQAAGDPHISTLDGLTYTFNGLAEYTLVEGNNFTLQGRTDFAYTTTPPSRATVFTALAARQANFASSDSDIIELKLNGTGLDVYRNGQWQDADFSGSGQAFTQVSVSEENGTYTVVFNSQVEVRVRVALNMTIFDVLAPASFKGHIKGLMGNFNGEVSDDLQYPNGTTISPNSSEAAIFELGQAWLIDPDTTLFSYLDGVNASTYGNRSFVPLFFDLDTMFADNATRQRALEVCGGIENRECLFDIALTGNEAVGEATKNSQTRLQEEKDNLANLPPTFTLNTTYELNVIAGQDLNPNFTVSASDANPGDTVTYVLGVSSPPGLTIDPHTGLLLWAAVPANLTANDSVQVIATDGKASAVVFFQVNLCDCQHGTCLFENVDQSSQMLTTVPCICNSGWEGDRCDRDIDGCADLPCFPSVTCEDHPAPQTGFTCGPCPYGLVGDGSACTDEDECMRTPSPCSQQCSNLPGGYQCACTSGFILTADLSTCQDVDECSRGTFSCDLNAVCNNTEGGYGCVCRTGYLSLLGTAKPGDCVDINECGRVNTCGPLAVCVNTAGSYRCDCLPGYQLDPVTQNCKEIDECAGDNDCHQLCMDGLASYTCNCTAGFTLSSADQVSCVPDQVCTSEQASICSTNGDANATCVIIDGSATCTCPPKYTLGLENRCDDLNECLSGSHLCNLATSACVNTLGDYRCDCHAGYKLGANGRTCVDVDECSERNLTTSALLHDCDPTVGVCTNTAGGFGCSCRAGYTLRPGGPGCDDVNECSSSAINECDRNYGLCNNTDGGYVCRCRPGFTGDGYVCADENECGRPDRGGCHQGCVNCIGTYSCFCGNGYRLNSSDGKSCDDFNECAREADNGCYSTAFCTNTVGSYRCGCPAEFVLQPDQKTCSPRTACADGHGCSDTCALVNGTNVCQCAKGYRLDQGGRNCSDFDECLSNVTHGCDPANNVMCVNILGGYRCQCSNSTFYQQVGTAKCIDIDECSTGTAQCPVNSLCENTEMGYTCNCDPGFQSSDGDCEDIDECANGTNLCHPTLATCSNTAGGYTCTCQAGYEGNGFTCSDVNECSRPDAAGCDVIRGRGWCVNFDGGHNCTCINGYELDDQGKLCDDINECSPSNPAHSCQQDCENLAGSYKCSCAPGFVLAFDGRNCTVKEACSSNNTCGQLCAVIKERETCLCQNRFYRLASDNSTCVDIDECVENNPCIGNSSVCHNLVNGYECSCSDGYRLDRDQLSCRDRDGGLSGWSNWTICSASCGGGVQTRLRTCTDPTPDGSGMNCTGVLSEQQQCNAQPCPLNQVEQTYGILVSFSGLNVQQFTAIQTTVLAVMIDSLNIHCNSDSAFTDCCPGYGQRTTNNNKTFTNETYVLIGGDYPLLSDDNQTEVLVVAKSPKTNALCADGSSAGSVGRSKRAVTLDTSTELVLPQAVLKAVVESAAVISDMLTVIAISYPNANVTISVAVAPLQTLPSTTVSTGSTARGGGVQTWIIVLAVVLSVLVIVVIVFLVLLLIKRPSKVQSSSSAVKSINIPQSNNYSNSRGQVSVSHA